MRIGIDCRIYSSKFTGLGRYTYELVNNFIKLNRRLKKPHELVLFFNDPEFKHFPARPHTQKILVNCKHYSLAEQTTFLFKLNKERLDLVHFPHFNVPIFYKKPFTVTIHDLILTHFPGRKMTKWYHRLAYHLTIKNAVKNSRKIIAVSNHTKEDLIKNFTVNPKKIEVIYNGISAHFQRLSAPSTASTISKTLRKYAITKPFLLYTGVWRNHKNLPRLLHALKILKEKFKLPLNLVITGRPDPHYPEVKNTVKELKLENYVIFPGLVEETELLHLYNAATIFVFPSLYEGFGLPPLEAMQCGTPVAASDTSSLPEICGKENAIFFDPYDPEDIAQKIALLHKDKALQQKLIKNGLAHVKNFDWPKAAEATWKVLSKALIFPNRQNPKIQKF